MKWIQDPDKPGMLILHGTPFAVRYDRAGSKTLPWLLTKDGEDMARFGIPEAAEEQAEREAKRLIRYGLIELDESGP